MPKKEKLQRESAEVLSYGTAQAVQKKLSRLRAGYCREQPRTLENRA